MVCCLMTPLPEPALTLSSLQWRHNERDGVSNHRRLDCLLNRFFRRRSNKHQSSASLAFVRGIHRWPVNSPHKGSVTRKIIPFDDVIIRAGVLGTRTRSTRVLNFLYLYCTRTREFQSHSTRTCTRTNGQVLRYSYEYWHEYWNSMVHLRCKGENHHSCEINSMTYHKGKVLNWFILL